MAEIPGTPPVTSTNQRRGTHPADLPTNCAYKNSFPKPIRVQVSWAGATRSPCMTLAINLSPTPNVDISVCLASLYAGHAFDHNPTPDIVLDAKTTNRIPRNFQTRARDSLVRKISLSSTKCLFNQRNQTRISCVPLLTDKGFITTT